MSQTAKNGGRNAMIKETTPPQVYFIDNWGHAYFVPPEPPVRPDAPDAQLFSSWQDKLYEFLGVGTVLLMIAIGQLIRALVWCLSGRDIFTHYWPISRRMIDAKPDDL